MEYRKLKQETDFTLLLNKISKENYPFILDSCSGYESKLGKFSFAGFNPVGIFKAKNNKVEIMENGSWKEYSQENIIEAFNSFFNKYKKDYVGKYPFNGGGVGFFSYDLCHMIEKLPRTAKDDMKIPDIIFCIYDGIFIFDHNNKEIIISAMGLERNKDYIFDYLENFALGKDEHIFKKAEYSASLDNKIFLSNFRKNEYLESIKKIKSYIKMGEVYQVNLTQRFSAKTEEDPWVLYERQRKINPAPFAAYLDYGDFQILSTSPERFVKIEGKIIETRPIKGTIARGKNKEEDKINKEILLNSEKDKSELLMIVDLERNDLGKISKPGTVKVEEIFALEEYPSVYHLVSTITGELRVDVELKDVINAVFPGGSITGTPKIRAMEIIDELEPTQRNVYTGSLGYIDFNGNLDLNIIIRTILLKSGIAYFQAGGAIVWDSEEEAEYEETLVKSNALKKSLEGKLR
jgi:para-aminobenzoate synthetase component 1